MEFIVKKVLSAFFLSLLPLVPLFGQASPYESSLSIEELYLQGPGSIVTMSALITSNDYEMQAAGIRSLRRAAEEGRVDPGSADYLRLMGFVLDQGVSTISRNWSHLPDSYHPMLRREAAGAIAAAGPAAVGHLVRTIRNDPEPTVTAEAMLALSGIPDIDTAAASLEVAIALRREAMTRGDETMLVAGFTALGNLADRTESADLNDIVRETVVLVVSQGYPAAVRDRAISALARM
jgi:hypothetical protein